MVKRLITMFSLFFSILIFVFFADLFLISNIYTSLDALSISVSHQIALDGKISEDIVSFVELSFSGAKIKDLNQDSVEFGGEFLFCIYEEYQPLIFSTETMKISITRSVTIGYLG